MYQEMKDLEWKENKGVQKFGIEDSEDTFVIN